ncbi:AAEL010056-PA [Aedes aegypti]|uniref:AAEL010056-PA n=1 Tax=Aedes aegypti TaxID=7159 RepID=Q16U14_AEDAE|nr:AAEL010056-PA [Aedes aegypti]
MFHLFVQVNAICTSFLNLIPTWTKTPQRLELILLVQIHIGQIDVLFFRKLPVLAVPGLDVVNLGQCGTLDRSRVPPTVGQISQELVDAFLREGSTQQRVLHLLDIDDGHRRIAKASNVQGGLNFRLGSAFGPQPAPLLFLVLFAHLGQDGKVVVPAGCITV